MSEAGRRDELPFPRGRGDRVDPPFDPRQRPGDGRPPEPGGSSRSTGSDDPDIEGTE